MQTPDWEDIVNAAENVGISRLSIIAYGYYGSRATGLATPESDEDIFVVIDTTVQKDEKMNISDACDIKFISAKEWPTNADFLFDIIAIGNIIFPKQIRDAGAKAERNPWAAYIQNYRTPVYSAMQGSISASRAADKRLENINRRETFDPISKLKRAKNARKEQVRKRKLEEYAYSMFSSDSPVYKPYFNAAEREYVLNG
jgi:hypothetical protein